MSTATLTLNLPEFLAQELKAMNQEFLIEILEKGMRELKIERALARYAQGNLSFGAAAQIANVSQSELAKHAYEQGMEPPSSLDTLHEELQ